MANKKVSQLVSKPSVLVTDLFPIADPTTGQLFKTTISDLGTAIGSGVSSVNTLVGAVVLDTDDIQELASPTNRWFTDTRARAALSASSPLAYNSGTGVFSIPQANGSTNGFLSSADWTTFNAKQTALNGTGFVKISGTTISYDNSTYLTTSGAASTYLALSGGTLTGALNGTSATFTGDLTLSATNPRLYFTDTDNNPDYFISNTDGTFTIYDVTNSTSRFTIGTTGNGTFGGNLTVGQIIRSGGTSSQFLKADGSVDSTAYLPLTGGTLTGNLNGTNITISNSLIAKGGTFNGGALAAGVVTIDGLSSNVLMNRTDTNNGTLISFLTNAVEMWHIGMRSGGTDNFVIYNSNLLANAVSVNISNSAVTLAGALNGTSASFSSSVTANNYVASGGNNTTVFNSASATTGWVQMAMNNTSGSSLFGVEGSTAGTLATGTLAYSSVLRNYTNTAFQIATNNTVRLTISGAGAATFTGALSGTSATFSGDVTTSGSGFQGRYSRIFEASAQRGGLYPYNVISGGGTDYSIGLFSESSMWFAAGGGITKHLNIASTGAATFTSSITATSLFVNAGTGSNLRVISGGTNILNVSNYSVADGFREFLLGGSEMSFYSGTAGGGSLSERMRITSSGSVGIGTTSPSGALQVSNDGYAIFNNSAYLKTPSLIGLSFGWNRSGGNGEASIVWGSPASTYKFEICSYVSSTITPRLTIDTSGNVGIGTTAPTQGKLVVSNAGPSVIANRETSVGVNSSWNASDGSVTFFGNESNHPLAFTTNNTERMRITSSGFLKASNNGVYFDATYSSHNLVSNSNGTEVLRVYHNGSSTGYGARIKYVNASPNGTDNWFLYCDDSTALRAEIRSNGGLANYQANNVNLSDERTKKEITPLESYWNKFKALEIVKFKYKDQTHDDFNIGVIAQQVESVAPEFVDADGWAETKNDETPLKSVYSTDLYHASIGVLKEAMAKIEALESEIQTLKNK